jgi:hypothetical protein
VLIALKVHGEEYKLRSLLWKFLHPSVASSSLLGPDILIILFSCTLNRPICFPLRTRDRVSNNDWGKNNIKIISTGSYCTLISVWWSFCESVSTAPHSTCSVAGLHSDCLRIFFQTAALWYINYGSEWDFFLCWFYRVWVWLHVYTYHHPLLSLCFFRMPVLNMNIEQIGSEGVVWIYFGSGYGPVAGCCE